MCSRYSRRQIQESSAAFFAVVAVFFLKCFKFLCEKGYINAYYWLVPISCMSSLFNQD